MKSGMIFGLGMAVAYSCVAMDFVLQDLQVTPAFSIYNEGSYWEPWKLFDDGDMKIERDINSILAGNNKKLSAVVSGNHKRSRTQDSSRGISKPKSQRTLTQRKEKEALAKEEALAELHTHIISGDVDKTYCVIKQQIGQEIKSVLGAKLMSVHAKEITSVTQFFEGLTEFPCNTLQMAQAFAKCGNNQKFLQAYVLYQENTEADLLDMC